jgi:hypothetical protein
MFSNRKYANKTMKKRVVYIFLFLIGTTQAQWNPAAPFYTPAEDCPVAMRICDATQEYNFELVSWGAIDDAHGMLYIPALSQSDFTRFESKVCWLKFTPQYSGLLGMDICRESPEILQYQMWTNPNCNDIEVTNYITPNTTSSTNIICTGFGLDSPNSTGGSSYLPYVNVEAGNTYVFLILTRFILQSGTHRFTLKFTGQLIQDHPDVFDHPDCLLSTENFETISATVYPNPFNNSLHIESNITFKTMELYDVLGKQIINQPFVSQFNTSSLAQGMYFLRLITQDGEVLVKKVVKE